MNPEFLHEKLLPYNLSHKGVVYKVTFIHEANHISFVKFSKKKRVDEESNPGPLRKKQLLYQMSHRGVVIEFNLNHGPTHILLARFLEFEKPQFT